MNMPRGTVAAFAAGAGGADSVTVLPQTLDDDDLFARRMARNTQLLLIDEAHAGDVSDPGAGSGAIEALTGEIAAGAWEAFRAIEREGGLLASIRRGTIQKRVADARDRRLAALRPPGAEPRPDGDTAARGLTAERARDSATAAERVEPLRAIGRDDAISVHLARRE
jgi:methylmalonyl-CoA mutase